MRENKVRITARDDSVDALKAVCAFLVICIHAPFPGTAGQYFNAICRIAVPIFFMITGYFYSDTTAKNREIKQIKKIFALLVEANLIYFLWKLFLSIVSHNETFFQETFTSTKLLKFLIFNESPFNGHLWYLGAILYVLIIVQIADKLNLRKILYWLTPILLIGDLILGKYSIVIWDKEFAYILVRNYLFVGVPYFIIGIWVKDGLGKRLSKKTLGGMILLFSCSSLLERIILININANATRDHYISTTFFAVTCFLFALKCDEEINSKQIDSNRIRKHKTNHLFTTIGRKYSTWIYILHPIFITCIQVLAARLSIQNIYVYVAPVVVYATTVIFCVVIHKAKEAMQKRH